MPAQFQRRGQGPGAGRAIVAALLPAVTALAALAATQLAAAQQRPPPQPVLTPSPPLLRSRDPAEARRRARPLFPKIVLDGGGTSPAPPSNPFDGRNNSTSSSSSSAAAAASVVVPTSICGDNSFTPADEPSYCQIVSTWYVPDGYASFLCSGFVIARKAVATAGHCIYIAPAAPPNAAGDAPAGLKGYPATIDVYCYGASGACANEATTWGTRALTTRRYTRLGGANAWDVAVIAVADDLVAATGKPAVPLSQVTRTRAFDARLVGYPNQNAESEACNSPEYEDGCTQYAATGNVNPSLTQSAYRGFYTSTSLDLCQGHSGSAVLDAATNRAVAIVSGYDNRACVNVFAPIVSSSNADGTTCERARGGASVDCLRRALERRGTQISPP